MNEETIKGLKDRLKRLERKHTRLNKETEESRSWLAEKDAEIQGLENEIKGLREILEPFIVAEEI